MKLSYKQKLFIYFFIVFAVFTVVITFFQQNREKSPIKRRPCVPRWTITPTSSPAMFNNII